MKASMEASYNFHANCRHHHASKLLPLTSMEASNNFHGSFQQGRLHESFLGSYYSYFHGNFHWELQRKFPQRWKLKFPIASKQYFTSSTENSLEFHGKKQYYTLPAVPHYSCKVVCPCKNYCTWTLYGTAVVHIRVRLASRPSGPTIHTYRWPEVLWSTGFKCGTTSMEAPITSMEVSSASSVDSLVIICTSTTLDGNVNTVGILDSSNKRSLHLYAEW